MRRTTIIFSFALLLLIINSCEKKTTPSPTGPIVATIGNSLADNGTFYFQPIWVKFSGDTFSFYSRCTDNAEEVEVYLCVKTKIPGTFLLSASNYAFNGASGSGSLIGFAYYTDSTHTGSVTVTKLDTINHIASGSFKFTAEEQEPSRNGGTDNLSNGSFTNLTW
jgi:hypothetical protein